MGAHIDIGFVRGVIAATLFVVFLAMWVWTYSPSRKAEFAALERLPLEPDEMDDRGKGPRTGARP